jgi:hypothetical protein
LLCRLAARRKKLLHLPLHLPLKRLPLLRLPLLLHLLLKPLPLHRPLTLLLHKLLPLHPTPPPPLPLLLPQRPKPPAPLLQPSNQHSDLKPAFWPVFFRLVKALDVVEDKNAAPTAHWPDCTVAPSGQLMAIRLRCRSSQSLRTDRRS